MEKHILIVDDEIDSLELMEELFTSRGFRAFTARNGVEALDTIAKNKPDVILTDVYMPEMDGYQLLEAVRAKYPDIQIILITAFGSIQAASDSIKKGAFDYILKPLRLDELLEKVENAFRVISSRRRAKRSQEKDAPLPDNRSKNLLEAPKEKLEPPAKTKTSLTASGKKFARATGLDIRQLAITNTDLHELYKASMFITQLAAHDFKSAVSTQAGYVMLAMEQLKSFQVIKQDGEEHIKFSQLTDKLHGSLEKILQADWKINEQFEKFFGQYRDLEFNNAFIAKPLKLLNQVKDVYEISPVSLDKTSYRSLEIVFPENVLFGIMAEFIKNAHKSMPRDVQVKVAWKIKDSKFVLEVHDNGPGIIAGLSEKFLPARLLNIELSGLNIIHKLATLIKGNLFFTKSKQLGGTCVYLDFPIIAYYLKGRIYEFRRS